MSHSTADERAGAFPTSTLIKEARENKGERIERRRRKKDGDVRVSRALNINEWNFLKNNAWPRPNLSGNQDGAAIGQGTSRGILDQGFLLFTGKYLRNN